jgi:hypothetical protein
MQSLAFLWFELRMTQQYLREKTFPAAQVPADAANLHAAIGTPGTRSDKGIMNRKKTESITLDHSASRVRCTRGNARNRATNPITVQ